MYHYLGLSWSSLGRIRGAQTNQLLTIRPTIPTPTNKPKHTNNTNNTRNTTTTNNTNTITTNPNHIAEAFSKAFARLRFTFWTKNGRVAFTRIHFMFFFPCPFPFIFSSVPFLHTYLSCSPCQVYFWRLMYIDFFLSFNFI